VARHLTGKPSFPTLAQPTEHEVGSMKDKSFEMIIVTGFLYQFVLVGRPLIVTVSNELGIFDEIFCSGQL
jgi:hypothetical protein